MINIFTISDKIIINKLENKSSNYISEQFFKKNIKVQTRAIFPTSFNFLNLKLKQEHYIFLIDYPNENLNKYLAEFLNIEFAENEQLKSYVVSYYKKYNKPLEKNDELLWTLPTIASGIVNPNNKVQGYFLEQNGSKIFVLPNDFNSLKNIFDSVVLDIICKDNVDMYINNNIKTFGLSEGTIKNILSNLIKNKDKISINIFSNGLQNDIVVKAKRDNPKLDEYSREVYARLSNYTYSVSESSLIECFEKALEDKNLKITLIECLSGGELISSLSAKCKNNNVCGAIIVPNANSKINILGIRKNLIDEFGEVSAECSYEMAVNGIGKTKSDLIVVTNGTLSSEGNQRGECYIAVGDKNKIDIYKNIFWGTDEEIIANITNATMFYCLKKINQNDFIFNENNV